MAVTSRLKLLSFAYAPPPRPPARAAHTYYALFFKAGMARVSSTWGALVGWLLSPDGPAAFKARRLLVRRKQ